MSFGVKILVMILSLSGVLALGGIFWKAFTPCTTPSTTTPSTTGTISTTSPSQEPTQTNPCLSSNRFRGLRSIWKDRTVPGGGTDTGK